MPNVQEISYDKIELNKSWLANYKRFVEEWGQELELGWYLQKVCIRVSQ